MSMSSQVDSRKLSAFVSLFHMLSSHQISKSVIRLDGCFGPGYTAVRSTSIIFRKSHTHAAIKRLLSTNFSFHVFLIRLHTICILILSIAWAALPTCTRSEIVGSLGSAERLQQIGVLDAPRKPHGHV